MKQAMKAMKNTATLLLLAAAVCFGCRREDPGYHPTQSGTEGKLAYISFAGDLLSVQWDGENLNNPAETKAAAPSPDDFIVSLVDSEKGETVKSFRYGARSQTPLSVPLGKYYVAVSSGEMKDVAWEGEEGQPTYGAKTAVFELTEAHDAEHPRKVDDIVCKLQSVKVSVWMEQSMADKCVPADTRIDVTLEGLRQVSFDAGEAHRYGVALLDEDKKNVTETVIDARSAYLKPVSEENRMELHVVTTYEGLPVDFSQTVSTSARAGEWRKIYLYSRTPEDEAGEIVIDVVIETFVYDEVVNVEVSSMVASRSEESIPDIDDPAAPRILAPGYSFHDVTRVSASDYDSFGNYVRSALVTVTLAHPVAHFTVRADSENPAFADFLASAGMSGKEIDLMNSADASTLVARTTARSWGFPGREEMEAQPESLSFRIDAFFNFIKDFTGRHVLALRVTDSEGKSSQAQLTIEVSADGSAAEPSPEGDPRIEWVGYDIRKRQVIEDGMTCKIDVYATKGIASMMIDISGAISDLIEKDLGGALPLSFDLCDPEAYGEGLGESLKQFGFPVGDEVLGQTAVVGKMDISTFLMLMPEGESDFAITVTDQEGNDVTETIMLLKR